MKFGRGRRVAILAAAAALGTTACSATTSRAGTTTTAAKSAASTTAPVTIPSSTPPLAVTPTTIMPASVVGGTVLLPAVNQAPAALATLVKVIDPARGADQFAAPIGSSRLVGVQLMITLGVTTPVAFDIAGATLLEDSNGNLYRPTAANIRNCPAFNGPLVKPGKRKLGCLTFDVDSTAKLTEVLFTPNGQFGNVSAEWDLK